MNAHWERFTLVNFGVWFATETGDGNCSGVCIAKITKDSADIVGGETALNSRRKWMCWHNCCPARFNARQWNGKNVVGISNGATKVATIFCCAIRHRGANITSHAVLCSLCYFFLHKFCPLAAIWKDDGMSETLRTPLTAFNRIFFFADFFYQFDTRSANGIWMRPMDYTSRMLSPMIWTVVRNYLFGIFSII